MYNETTLLVKVIETVGDGGAKSTPVHYRLSDTAINLWIANEVVLEREFPDAPDVESGETYYSQLFRKQLLIAANIPGKTDTRSAQPDDSEDGYYFLFDTGDEFYSATADGYPELIGDNGIKIGTTSPGSGLPDFSQASNGDVLAIDRGEPAWVGYGGGGGVLVCHGTVAQDGTDMIYTIDKTWKEIHDAEFAVLVWTPDEFPADNKVYNNVAMYSHVEGHYAVQFETGISEYLFASGADGVLETDSENGYPSYIESELH